MKRFLTSKLLEALLEKKPSLIFVDVDGVLLDFDIMLWAKALELGLSPPSWKEWQTRSHPGIFEAYPDFIDEKTSWELCQLIFDEGGLKTQPSYPYLDQKRIGHLLSFEHTYILTKVPEGVLEERSFCLTSHYGTDFTNKIISSWTRPKGEIILEICGEQGVSSSSALLIDDNPDYLESALSRGVCGVLVEHSYNESARPALAEKYGELFSSISHRALGTLLFAILPDTKTKTPVTMPPNGQGRIKP